MLIGRSLKYFLNKAIKEKRDIFIVSLTRYKDRIKMGGCTQYIVEYDEDGSSILRTNTGCRFERATISSLWLNDKYIEKEIEYDEWYKQNSMDEWEIIKGDTTRVLSKKGDYKCI